jgi:hypothetical protein
MEGSMPTDPKRKGRQRRLSKRTVPHQVRPTPLVDEQGTRVHDDTITRIVLYVKGTGQAVRDFRHSLKVRGLSRDIEPAQEGPLNIETGKPCWLAFDLSCTAGIADELLQQRWNYGEIDPHYTMSSRIPAFNNRLAPEDKRSVVRQLTANDTTVKDGPFGTLIRQQIIGIAGR